MIPLVEAWASYKKGRVRLSATEVLSRGAQQPAQLESVLEVLDRWVGDQTNVAYGRRWTAAVTFGRLSQAAPDKAIAGLRRIAEHDPHRFVRSGVPKALRPLVLERPSESKRIFTALAADSDPYTRREVSQVLRTISYRQPDYVGDLLRSWCPMESANRSWTLARTCLIIPRALQHERIAVLDQCVRDHPDEAVSALQDALKHKNTQPDRAWTLVEGLLERDPTHSHALAPLSIVLRDCAADLAWERLGMWSEHSSPQIRRAAAHVLAHWKTSDPQRAAPLLERLLQDVDPEVVVAASMEPPLILLPEEIGELEEPGEELDGDTDVEALIRFPDDAAGPSTDDIQILILDE